MVGLDGLGLLMCALSAQARLGSRLHLGRGPGDADVLLDAGDSQGGGGLQSLSDVEMVTPIFHAPMQDAVWRGFGGTSKLWGGRCVPLFPDFASRARQFVANGPLRIQRFSPLSPHSTEFLGAGSRGSQSLIARVLHRRGHRWRMPYLEMEPYAHPILNVGAPTNQYVVVPWCCISAVIQRSHYCH